MSEIQITRNIDQLEECNIKLSNLVEYTILLKPDIYTEQIEINATIINGKVNFDILNELEKYMSNFDKNWIKYGEYYVPKAGGMVSKINRSFGKYYKNFYIAEILNDLCDKKITLLDKIYLFLKKRGF